MWNLFLGLGWKKGLVVVGFDVELVIDEKMEMKMKMLNW